MKTFYVYLAEFFQPLSQCLNVRSLIEGIAGPRHIANSGNLRWLLRLCEKASGQQCNVESKANEFIFLISSCCLVAGLAFAC
jgi:hypothetical protein